MRPRMWPAWYYLTGLLQRVSSTCARERPAWPHWTGTLENVMVFLGLRNSARVMLKPLVIEGVYVDVAAEVERFWKDFAMRAHVAHMILIDWISCNR